MYSTAGPVVDITSSHSTYVLTVHGCLQSKLDSMVDTTCFTECRAVQCCASRTCPDASFRSIDCLDMSHIGNRIEHVVHEVLHPCNL